MRFDFCSHILSKSMRTLVPFVGTFICCAAIASAEVKVQIDHNPNDSAAAGFQLKQVPPARRGDLASKAKFTLVEGERDPNSSDLNALHDGSLPIDADQPRANFFFRGEGGRIAIELPEAVDLSQINTYSWHPEARGPQSYAVYISDGKSPDFKADPKRPEDPAKVGWKLLGKVDTTKDGAVGGQYGVSITDSTGNLGNARYILFDIAKTSDSDSFANTFYSEIDVLDKKTAETEEPQLVDVVEIKGTPYRFTIDTNEAPDLTEWARRDLTPVMEKWYPMIVDMLPGDGFQAPRTFSINFTNSYRGVAATGGNRVVGSPTWYRQNLKGEAIGSLVHELVHVVQQYGRRRPGGTRPPGWLIEGIPDYIRWYLYEPESHGCEITSSRAVASARHDASYRVSANFLNFVINKYDKDLVRELNRAMREGNYSEEIWKTRTQHTLEELSTEWKTALESGVKK